MCSASMVADGMAKAARAYTLEHHTARARIEYVVATVLGRKLDGSPAETD